MPDVDDDQLDGLCELGFDPPPTSDAHAPYVVLFCDVDLSDAQAVAHRAWEWKELFARAS